MPPSSNPGLGKRFAGSVAFWLSGLVTTTSTAPAACAGVVAVMLVLLTTFTEVAATPPKVTLAPDTKFVPVMVALVPPLAVPLFGEIEVMVGGCERAVVVEQALSTVARLSSRLVTVR